jgi:hypothetical protein
MELKQLNRNNKEKSSFKIKIIRNKKQIKNFMM